MASGLIILPLVRLTLIILASRVVYTSLYIIPRLAALICTRLILITLFGGLSVLVLIALFGGLSVLVLIALFGRFIVLPLITFTNGLITRLILTRLSILLCIGLIITALVSWVTLIRLTFTILIRRLILILA